MINNTMVKQYKYQNYFLIAIIIIACLVTGYFLGHLQSKQTTQSQINELHLTYKRVIVGGVTNEERQNVETFISEFESYQYQKSPDKLLTLFTPPETKD